MIFPFAIGLLIGAILFLATLAFKSNEILDRLVFINLVNVKLAMLLTAFSVLVDSQMILDISMTYGLIGFLSSVTLSRFLLKGGLLK